MVVLLEVQQQRSSLSPLLKELSPKRVLTCLLWNGHILTLREQWMPPVQAHIRRREWQEGLYGSYSLFLCFEITRKLIFFVFFPSQCSSGICSPSLECLISREMYKCSELMFVQLTNFMRKKSILNWTHLLDIYTVPPYIPLYVSASCLMLKSTWGDDVKWHSGLNPAMNTIAGWC